jgi:hypothetical protein
LRTLVGSLCSFRNSSRETAIEKKKTPKNKKEKNIYIKKKKKKKVRGFFGRFLFPIPKNTPHHPHISDRLPRMPPVSERQERNKAAASGSVVKLGQLADPEDLAGPAHARSVDAPTGSLPPSATARLKETNAAALVAAPGSGRRPPNRFAGEARAMPIVAAMQGHLAHGKVVVEGAQRLLQLVKAGGPRLWRVEPGDGVWKMAGNEEESAAHAGGAEDAALGERGTQSSSSSSSSSSAADAAGTSNERPADAGEPATATKKSPCGGACACAGPAPKQQPEPQAPAPPAKPAGGCCGGGARSGGSASGGGGGGGGGCCGKRVARDPNVVLREQLEAATEDPRAAMLTTIALACREHPQDRALLLPSLAASAAVIVGLTVEAPR